MDKDSKALFEVNQNLCELSKSTLLSFIAHRKKEKIELHNTHHLLLAYCYKAIDLFEGIIKLQQLNPNGRWTNINSGTI